MKSVVVILAVIIIGGGVWFYLNLNKNNSKIMDNLSNQEPKLTTQNNSQSIPSSSTKLSFSCKDIISQNEIATIFGPGVLSRSDPIIDEINNGRSGKQIICSY